MVTIKEDLKWYLGFSIYALKRNLLASQLPLWRNVQQDYVFLFKSFRQSKALAAAKEIFTFNRWKVSTKSNISNFQFNEKTFEKTYSSAWFETRSYFQQFLAVFFNNNLCFSAPTNRISWFIHYISMWRGRAF